jgi:RNA polymerase sigma-70 factor (ECF subfamily)
VLHHVCDLPVRDVAREVGVPEGTVKARLSRGRTALAALLADGSPPSPGGSQEGANHV